MREGIRRAIDEIAELGSGRQALVGFHERGLELPTRVTGGPVPRRRPHPATLRAFVDDPAQGGASAYGPREEWPVPKPGAYGG